MKNQRGGANKDSEANVSGKKRQRKEEKEKSKKRRKTGNNQPNTMGSSYFPQGQINQFNRRQPAYREKKKKRKYTFVKKNEQTFIRQCTACASVTPPCWRRGPLGVGTLCNACGLRWKNKRLILDERTGSEPNGTVHSPLILYSEEENQFEPDYLVPKRAPENFRGVQPSNGNSVYMPQYFPAFYQSSGILTGKNMYYPGHLVSSRNGTMYGAVPQQSVSIPAGYLRSSPMVPVQQQQQAAEFQTPEKKDGEKLLDEKGVVPNNIPMPPSIDSIGVAKQDEEAGDDSKTKKRRKKKKDPLPFEVKKFSVTPKGDKQQQAQRDRRNQQPQQPQPQPHPQPQQQQMQMQRVAHAHPYHILRTHTPIRPMPHQHQMHMQQPPPPSTGHHVQMLVPISAPLQYPQQPNNSDLVLAPIRDKKMLTEVAVERRDKEVQVNPIRCEVGLQTERSEPEIEIQTEEHEMRDIDEDYSF